MIVPMLPSENFNGDALCKFAQLITVYTSLGKTIKKWLIENCLSLLLLVVRDRIEAAKR